MVQRAWCWPLKACGHTSALSDEVMSRFLCLLFEVFLLGLMLTLVHSLPWITIKTAKTKCLPCTGFCSNFFICITSFMAHNNPMKHILLSHFTWRMRKLRHSWWMGFSKITEHSLGGFGIHNQVARKQKLILLWLLSRWALASDCSSPSLHWLPRSPTTWLP